MTELKFRTLGDGVNQRGIRDYNERLVLSLIQRSGALPGSKIARHARLSPQTVSVILRQLESDGLILRGTPVKGRVGKPSVPVELAPNGAFSFGLKIGRRTADLVLTDFRGQERGRRRATYRHPLPFDVLHFLKDGIDRLSATLCQDDRARIVGLGIGMPFEIWNWHGFLNAANAASDTLDDWRTIDLKAEIAGFTDLPVYIMNDVTAACRAEHVIGRGHGFVDYAYFFVGAFVGGGLVLNNAVHEGNRGNAGAFGSLATIGPDGQRRQLVDTASIYLLETALEAAGLDPTRLWTEPQDWREFEAFVDPWLTRTAGELAQAILAVCAVIDFEAVLIDGGFPPQVRDRLVERTRAALVPLDHRGIVMPRIEAGTVGRKAPALGAAGAPVSAQFFLGANATATHLSRQDRVSGR